MQPNQTYDGTITGGTLIMSRSGTPGLQLAISYEEDGFTAKTSRVLWLTNKTIKQVKNTLGSLGLKVDNLASETYLENIGQALEGTEITFTTEETDYNGVFKTQVQWINPRRAPIGSESPAKIAARLFGGTVPPLEQIPEAEDVPF
jgi:hypothetical protein